VKGEWLKGHLDVLLLAVLQEAPAHGYAIIEALRRRSRGAFDLPEGTVYPALHRLERADLLASRWSVESGRRRRTYALTPRGRALLDEYQNEWRRFAQGVDAVLQGAEVDGEPD
jgi:DNA-binding PadR family transcriptional regulator